MTRPQAIGLDLLRNLINFWLVKFEARYLE
jgi:hypothetical protein